MLHHDDAITIAEADRDEAVGELGSRIDRRTALSAGLLGGAGLLTLGTGVVEAATRSDIAILNFALVLEELEAAFYAEAVRRGNLDGELALFARVVRDHERAHVRALRRALGRRAVARPRFEFRNTTASAGAFTRTSISLEETGLGAYKGQAPAIDSKAILAAALAIHSIEGRHTAWIRDLAGLNPAPNGLDAPLTRSQTLARVRRTRFIVD